MGNQWKELSHNVAGKGKPISLRNEHFHRNPYRTAMGKIDLSVREDILIGTYCEKKHHKVLFKNTGEIVLLNHKDADAKAIQAHHHFSGQKAGTVNRELGTARFRCAEIRELFIKFVTARSGYQGEIADIRKGLPKEVRKMADEERQWHQRGYRSRLIHMPHEVAVSEEKHRKAYRKDLEKRYIDWCRHQRAAFFDSINNSDYAIPQGLVYGTPSHGEENRPRFIGVSPLDSHISACTWVQRVRNTGFLNAVLLEDHAVLKSAADERTTIWDRWPNDMGRDRVLVLDAHPVPRAEGTPVLIGFSGYQSYTRHNIAVWGMAYLREYFESTDQDHFDCPIINKNSQWLVRIEGSYNDRIVFHRS